MIELIVFLGGALRFVRDGAAQVGAGGVVYPYIMDCDPVRETLSGLDGDASGESASVSLSLVNTRGESQALLGSRPLRASAQLWVNGALYFSGLIGSVEIGPVYRLTLET